MRREITGHESEGAEVSVTVFALDEKAENGASHQYRIDRADGSRVAFVNFHEGEWDSEKNDVNGATDESIMVILADRLRGFQEGPNACKAYSVALRKIEDALEALRKKVRKSEEKPVDAKKSDEKPVDPPAAP